VDVLPSDAEKWQWLVDKLPALTSAGPVLIFVSTKNGCEELSKNLLKLRYSGTPSLYMLLEVLSHPCVAHGVQ
jgi:superfamily II DNA/RNA helicase